MHRLLKRQLKKLGIVDGDIDKDRFLDFIKVVEQAYFDTDDDRNLLENTLAITSAEMKGLYEELEEKSNKELARSEEKYGRLIQNLQGYYFFYSYGVDRVFTYLSESITDVLGYSEEEFLRHYDTYLTDESMNEKIEEYTSLSIAGVQQKPYQISIYHKDGSIYYLEVTEIPILNENGEVLYVDGIARNITEYIASQKEIGYLARHDALTGLPNRIHLETQLDKLIQSSSRNESKFALLFLDLDYFKQINDTLGHDIGDQLLQEVAKRISGELRAEDLFARLGGDEFIVVLMNIDALDLTSIINKIMNLVRKPWFIQRHELKIGVSVGVALYPEDGSTMQDLMKRADIAMYKAKELGRDNFSFFTEELSAKVHHNMKLEQGMAEALVSNEFTLFYQPKMQLKDNVIIGAEALIRWQHPSLGLIFPDSFIELAENTGFIHKLGTWVIQEGCQMIARSNAKTGKRLHLSLNVSTRQLQNDEIYDHIKKSLDESGIEPYQLHIEITETIMVDRSDQIIGLLEKISALGVHISMDDFGTGYSSLSYLARLPINSLKIDKAFVQNMSQSREKKVLLSTIIAMGNALNMEVIAEGVEEEYQREFLIQENCKFYQGYLFSKPVTEEYYLALLV